ncbi:17S U2 SnRNP complex component HTATSF1-like [Asterias amurensis]|uniref:17S U2 SnRNP complex component HTATSF1-like n=1 Tax=Asterias amurensis TaxID=7602 RepID=UPI003AB2AF0C
MAEEDDFERQLQLEKEEQSKIEQGYTYTDPNDGTEYEWDAEKQAWFPKVDEDFLAAYQANYGVNTNEQSVKSYYEQYAAQLAAEQPKLAKADSDSEEDEDDDDDNENPEGSKKRSGGRDKSSHTQKETAEEQKPKAGQKRKGEEGWFEMDESKNTNVYVSGLPEDITPTEFEELMSKCGVIMFDEEKQENKIKLYLDHHGNIKGDGRCCYLKRESVELAIQLLDDSDLRGNKIHVELARFQMKGDFQAKPKKKKPKKKKKNYQEKLLDWRPEKKFHQRKRNEQVVIIKHLFHPEEFEEDAMVINEIKDDLQSECSKYGEVKKVIIFDRHPDGVASVKFKDVEFADLCVAALNGRWFAKRQLSCELWDGVTDFRIEETDREREERLKKWENFLESDKGKEKTEGNTTKCSEEGVESSSKPEESQKAGSNSTSNTESVDAT